MWRILQIVVVVMSGGLTLASAEDRLKIVVSIPPQRWLVEQIGGDRVDVKVLVAPGESPTTYQPTDAQVTHLLQAKIYFRIGVPFERGLWFEALGKMARLERIDVRAGIELQGDDPHIWLSPRLLSIQAATVAASLSRHDPTERDFYAANLNRLETRMEALDEEIRQMLEPFAGRSFFVFHPSWGYFSAAYGLEQIAVEKDGREPSDWELTVLQRQARKAGITTVFVQPQIYGRGAQAFAESIGAELQTLDPLVADVAVNLAETADKLKASFSERETRGQ